jgi:hypothetical protein
MDTKDNVPVGKAAGRETERLPPSSFEEIVFLLKINKLN